MQPVDLVCSPEDRPRAKLLQEHMAQLGVPVVLHEAVPEAPSGIVLFVVTHGHVPDVGDLAPERRFALHFDGRPSQLAAAYHARLAAWPARSADAEVRKLVHALHRGGKRNAGAAEAASDGEPVAQARRRVEPANRTGLIAIVIIVVGFGVLLQTDFEPADSQEPSSAAPAEPTQAAETPAVADRAPRPRRQPPRDTGSDRSTLAHFCRASSPEAKAAWFRLLDTAHAEHPCVTEYRSLGEREDVRG